MDQIILIQCVIRNYASDYVEIVTPVSNKDMETPINVMYFWQWGRFVAWQFGGFVSLAPATHPDEFSQYPDHSS